MVLGILGQLNLFELSLFLEFLLLSLFRQIVVVDPIFQALLLLRKDVE